LSLACEALIVSFETYPGGLGEFMLKQWRVALIMMVVMAFGIFISACGSTASTPAASTPAASGSTPAASTAGTPGAYNCVQGSLTTNGSTALGPLVQKVAADYQSKCSGASITTQLTGSGAGLTAVSGGNAGIGNSDVYASATKYPGLIDHQVAVIPFAVVLNSQVTGVTNLTSAQIKDIYTGKVTNWKQVGGPSLPIVVISRPAGSGTRVTFEQFILSGTTESVSGPSHLTESTTGAVQKAVAGTAGSIAYLAASGIGAMKAISIDGIAESDANVQNNTYKFWNVEHMYTKGDATGLAQAFIDYMTSPTAKQLAQSLHFIDITAVQQSILATRQPAA
jgi:phosphate transport system substrate-binding protein